MKTKIRAEQIHSLNQVWHACVDLMQRSNAELLGDELKEATTVEISILSIVEKTPDVILKEIIQALEIPASTLTSAIDRLEKRGLVQRVISKRDRRSFGLELTEKGKAAQKNHRKGEEVLWRKVLGAYDTDEEREAFIRLTQKLVDNFNRTEGVGE